MFGAPRAVAGCLLVPLLTSPIAFLVRPFRQLIWFPPPILAHAPLLARSCRAHLLPLSRARCRNPSGLGAERCPGCKCERGKQWALAACGTKGSASTRGSRDGLRAVAGMWQACDEGGAGATGTACWLCRSGAAARRLSSGGNGRRCSPSLPPSLPLCAQPCFHRRSACVCAHVHCITHPMSQCCPNSNPNRVPWTGAPRHVSTGALRRPVQPAQSSPHAQLGL